MSEYLSMKASNSLLRRCLAANFPGVKFSVVGEKYSMGSSTTVSWTDGPTVEQVEKIAAGFSYKGFDGMIDMAFDYRQALLPSGQIVIVGSPGTTGSRGTFEPFDIGLPEGAKPVSSGIGYLHYSRKLSEEWVDAVAKKWATLPEEDRHYLIEFKMRRRLESEEAQIRDLARLLPAKRIAA